MAAEGISRYDQVPTAVSDEPTSGAWWAFGIILFAGCMMLMMAFFSFFQGLAAVIKGNFFVVVPNYAFQVDTTTWGWIHMLLGIVTGAAGVFLFFGKMWARIIAIAVALVSAVWNFLSIPYYPVWSILIVVLDILVIWAVAWHGRDMQDVMD
jgi:hypothetical protein